MRERKDMIVSDFWQLRHDIDTGTELAELDGLPDLVDFALVDAESLSVSFDLSPSRGTYRSNPFLASTLYTRPIEVPNLGSAFLVGTDDLASNIPILEDRFHPSQLIISLIIAIKQLDLLAQQSIPSIWG
jgi:hypothetical protein